MILGSIKISIVPKEELNTHGCKYQFSDKAKVTSLLGIEYLHGKGMLANKNSRRMSDANLGQGILLTGYKELCDSDIFCELFDSKRLKNILGDRIQQQLIKAW